MSDDVSDAADTSKDKNKICNFCETILRKGQKCSVCKVNAIHLKCLDVIQKTGNIVDRKDWLCKTCTSMAGSSSSSEEDVTIIYDPNTDNAESFDVKKENAMLKSQIVLLNKLVNELSKVNKLQQQRIDYLEESAKTMSYNPTVVINTQNQRATAYSDILKKPGPKNSVIIKPVNNKQSSDVTRKEIKDAINPAVLSIGVSKFTQRKDGSVLINCDDSENLEILKTNISSKMGDTYETVAPRNLLPKIIIYNVNAEDISNRDNFCSNLFVQNKLERTDSTSVRIVRIVNKKSDVDVIIELDPITFKTILLKKSLYVGWRRCHIRESFHVIRCYNCSKFGHLSKDCNDPIACPKCAEKHPLKECKAQLFNCINCIDNNKKFNSKFDVNHASFDHDCSCYKKLINYLRSITNYSTE